MTVEVHNPDQTESKPLNTELEVLAPELTAEQTDLSPETNPAPDASENGGEYLAGISASSSDQPDSAAVLGASSHPEPDYDAADFAAALANFDREQAAETAAASAN